LDFMFGSWIRSMREFQMRSQISFTALGLALLAGTTAASAQTVITRDISGQPVATVVTQQPVQTVQTIQTTRTIGPARTGRRRVVTTRRTITTERVVPATTVVPAVAATYPQPLYDVATPLYDTAVAPPPAPVGAIPVAEDVAPPVYAAPGTDAIPTYRYVYEPDRILVIDPSTNIAVQALPR
jgi:hypothetical protein